MEPETDFLLETANLNLQRIKQCVQRDPDCIHSRDSFDNNAMHICVAALASIRAPEVMEYFLKETKIDLLQKNAEDRDPLDLAMAINDENGCEMIEPYWQEQLNRKFPLEDEPKLSVVPSGNRSGPKPNP